MMFYRMVRAIADIGLNERDSLDESIRLLTAFLREQRDKEQCAWCGRQWLYLFAGWAEEHAGRRQRLEHFRESVDLLLSERAANES